jgi:glycosyltransferase involved in cell wall biosynthesis
VTISLLRQLDPDRYDLSLLLLRREGEYLSSVPGYVQVLDLGDVRARNAVFPLLRTIRREKPNIVFSTHGYINIICLFSSFFLGSDVAFFARQPVMPQASAAGDGMSIFYKLLLRVLYPRARRIIAQTHAMRDAMVKVFGLPRERIEVLINPLDKDLIDDKVEGEENPFDPQKANIVAAGRLVHQKGFDVLLKAFRIVSKREPDARLYILGEGDDRPKLEGLIRDYELSDVVTLMGFKSNPYPYFRFADLYVLSSRWEGLPNTVLESLYLQTPCVATRCIPFMADIIQEPDNGALVDVEDVESLAEKLLRRESYRLSPELMERAGTVRVDTLLE